MEIFDPNTLFGLFSVAAVMFAAFFVARSGKKGAAAEVWRGEAAAIKAKAERLQQENSAMAERIAKLETLPDLSKLMGLMVEDRAQAAGRYEASNERLSELFEQHEMRAAERHAVMMKMLRDVATSMAALKAGMLDLVGMTNGNGGGK